jgi:tRNA threonylcarbamoyladenosine biosynthesis protein TsaB
MCSLNSNSRVYAVNPVTNTSGLNSSYYQRLQPRNDTRFVQAVPYALDVPMIGVPSLDLLAFPVRFTPRLIVATIDARRGELFYAFYRQVPGGIQRITDHQVGTPDDLASELMASGEECLLVGDGAIRYSEVFEGLKKCEIAEEGFAYPNATSLVMLAHAQALREQWVKPWDLEPMYLRKPDAEINWSTRPGA